MSRFKGVFLIAILLCSTIVLVANPFDRSSGVLAYYDDVKSTSGCYIYAPANSTPLTPTQADMLSVTGPGTFDNTGKQLTGLIALNSNSTMPINITSIRITSSNFDSGEQITGIGFGSGNFNSFFSGSVNPGTDIVGTKKMFNANENTIMNIQFKNQAGNNRPITFVFTMGDKSTKTITI